MRQAILTVLLTLVSAGTARADEIRVLCTGPLEDGLVVIAESYRARTGHEVTIETGTTPVVAGRLEAGETFDIVIATRSVVDGAAARGQVDASTAIVVGRVGVDEGGSLVVNRAGIVRTARKLMDGTVYPRPYD